MTWLHSDVECDETQHLVLRDSILASPQALLNLTKPLLAGLILNGTSAQCLYITCLRLQTAPRAGMRHVTHPLYNTSDASRIGHT